MKSKDMALEWSQIYMLDCKRKCSEGFVTCQRSFRRNEEKPVEAILLVSKLDIPLLALNHDPVFTFSSSATISGIHAHCGTEQ